MFESGEIMVKSIVLKLPHLGYYDSPPHQNLSMKLGMHVDNTMIQHPSKLGGMSIKIGRVGNYV